MSVLDNIEMDNWEKDEKLESSFTNNMVTKHVEAYRCEDCFLLVRKTKQEWSVELYRESSPPNSKVLLNYEGDLTKSEVKDAAETCMAEM